MTKNLPRGTFIQGAKNKYQIEKVLGQGAFGITYLAQYKTKVNGEIGSGFVTAQVCIKEFFMKDFNTRGENTYSLHDISGIALVEKYRKSFMREAKNLARMHHPGIVNVFEVIETNNTIYIVMEYMDGGSLDEYIRQKGRLTESEALDCFRPICEAMHYMHLHKMLHLDMKPKNIMRDSDGRLYIIDFGLSKQYDANGEPESSTTIGLGTPGYAPSEQAKINDGDNIFRTTIDVYALGATLYKMLTGKTPPDATEVSNSIVDGGNLVLQSLKEAGISSDLAQKISIAMWPSSNKRTQTVAELMKLFGWDEPKMNIFKKKSYVETNIPAQIVSKHNVGINQHIEYGTAHTETEISDIKTANSPLEKKKRNFIISAILGTIILGIIYYGYVFYEPQKLFERAEAYYHGNGVEQSYEQAVQLYFQAAKHGHSKAQYSLGRCYDSGKGVDKSFPEAVKWYKMAADQGNTDAQFALGLKYHIGQGIEASSTEAVKWYKKAADQGNADAQFMIGSCFEYGDGVDQSYIEAAKWYKKAADQGSADAQCSLGSCYARGYGVDQSDTEAMNWFRMSANQDNHLAQYFIGQCYYYGSGIEQSPTEAVKWYRKAAEQGYAEAQNAIGQCYYYGDGLEQSYTEAIEWFRKAADQGNTEAQNHLGFCYDQGIGISIDYTEAEKWYRKAADQGDATGQFNLGVQYKFGKGVPQDDTEAVNWWTKSAEQGYASARFNLGLSYYRGEGIAKDTTKAIELWKKAAKQGDEDSIEQLKELGISF